jgi:hypothetical protein
VPTLRRLILRLEALLGRLSLDMPVPALRGGHLRGGLTRRGRGLSRRRVPLGGSLSLGVGVLLLGTAEGRLGADAARRSAGRSHLGQQVEQSDHGQPECGKTGEKKFDLLREVRRTAENSAEQSDQAEQRGEPKGAHGRVDHEVEPRDHRTQVTGQQHRADKQRRDHRRGEITHVSHRTKGERQPAEQQPFDADENAHRRDGDHEPCSRFSKPACLDIDHNYPHRVFR